MLATQPFYTRNIWNLGGAIVALSGYHISLATCTKLLNNEDLNISV